MAVRDDFTAGEVLAAADLNDTFASKAPVASPTFTGTVTLPDSVVGSQSPNRNLLYNGAMQVAQRGTSTAGITSAGYYTTDRWLFTPSNMGTWTMTVESDGPSGSGFTKSSKVLCTTADAAPAAGDFILFQQSLEGQDLQRIAKGTATAQQLSVSFWVKSNVTGTYIYELVDLDNTRIVCASYTVSVSGTWEKKTIVFPPDTTGSFDNDNGGSLISRFFLGAGSNFTSGTLQTTWAASVQANQAVGQVNLAAATDNYWQVTGVQLEVGPAATPFEFKSFGQELRECQRYYYRVFPGAAGRRFGSGYNTGTVQSAVYISFPTTLRTAPSTLETSGTANHYAVAHAATRTVCSTVPTINHGDTAGSTCLFNVASGLTTGQGCTGDTDSTNGASAYLAWSAEL